MLALGLLPVLAGVGATRAAPAMQQNSLEAKNVTIAEPEFGFALTLVVAALLYLCLLTIRPHGTVVPAFTFIAAGLDGCLAALSLLCLRRLGATLWAAQFLLVPLLTLVEGAVLLRPVLDDRSWAAFGLLAVSGAYQLFLR